MKKKQIIKGILGIFLLFGCGNKERIIEKFSPEKPYAVEIKKERSFYQAVYFKFRFTLSYRDVEEMLKIRGVIADYSTIQRWVFKFSPRIEAKDQIDQPLLSCFKTFKSLAA